MQFKRFRKAYNKYSSWAKARRPGIIKANKTALKTVWRAINTLRKETNAEHRFWDQSSAITSVIDDVTGYRFLPWDGLDRAAGTGSGGRVGDQVKALYTSVKFTLENVAATTGGAAAHNVRVIAFLDTEPRGDAPMSVATVKSQILQLTSTGALTMNSPYNTTQASGNGVVGDRYKILKDFTIQLDNIRVKQRCIKLYFNHTKNRYKGMKVKYEEANDYPADNRLYVILLTDSPAANTDIEVKGALTRMCYVDN